MRCVRAFSVGRVVLIPVFALCFSVAACQLDSKQQVVATDRTQVELRAAQTRAFDTTDKKRTIRTIIATLQDLGFIIGKSDETLGVVSGSKSGMMMTVTVRARGSKQTAVRASAQHGITAVSDPAPYQQFFIALEKAMFLEAHAID